MKKLKLFISLWFTMFSVAVFAQAEFEKIAITQNTLDNSAGRLIVQDATTGELKYILKSVLDNKFNQPTGDATQYLDGAGNPTAFPVLGQADRVITEVRNTTGATVVKGTVVYLSGASGGKATIQKAQANSELTSSGTFGVIQSDINNNSNGYAVVIGTVLGVNTSSYTEGQVLWLSPTVAGGFTSTKPVAPNHAVYVAIVTLAATNGTIEVKVQNGYEIDELHDVLITSKANNDAIVYDSASGLWKNKQLVADVIADGTTTVAPSQNAVFDALAAKENTSSKNVANGYAGLGSDGKLFSTQLPSITITDTFVVGSQAAMLALTAETGDVAVRTDVNKSFILKGSDPAVLANWQELLTPTSAVTSVFGRNGAVTAQNGDYTTALVTETTNKRYQTDNQQTYNDATSSIQTQLNSKANDNTVVHLAGSESITGAKTFTATPSFDSNIYLKQLSSWANPAGYTVIGGRTDGFLLSASATKSALIGLSNLTQAWTYDFPNKSGTFAMTSDVPTISGTTNYISKFTGASSLGGSSIYDNSGKIGINTTTTPYRFNVYDTSDAVVGHFGGGVSNYTLISFKSNEANVYSTSLGSYDSGMLFRTGATDRMYINSSGNVGIGTVTPAQKLDVFGISRISNTTPALQLFNTTSGDNWATLQAEADAGTGGKMVFYTKRNGNSENAKMTIRENGYIGIGTTTPDTGLLSILKNSTYNNYGGAGLSLQSNVNNAYTELQMGADDTQNIGYIQSLARNTSFTTKALSLNPNGGNVGIGTINPVVKFEVQSSGVSARFASSTNVVPVSIFNTGSSVSTIGFKGSTTSNDYVVRVGADANNFVAFTSDTERMRITDAGATSFTGSVTATGFFQSSDSRLKDIVKRDGDVIYYKWKDARDAKLHIGYVAQEVQKENPEQVNTDDKGMLSVNYIEILVEKIRKLEKEIELLKAK